MKKLASGIFALLLSACASLPNSPGILVLPGTGKSFDQFRGDENECRMYAYNHGNSQNAGYGPQQRYDFAFTQCMYAKGHRVPISGRYADAPAVRAPTPSAHLPPPPPGQPPAEAPPDYRKN